MAQMVKNLPAMQETWDRPLGWEDPLEEGMAAHSSILTWRIPMDRGAWWATVHRVAKSWTERLTLSVSFYFHNDVDSLKKITPEWVFLPSSWHGKNSAFEMTFQYESSGSEESELFMLKEGTRNLNFKLDCWGIKIRISAWNVLNPPMSLSICCGHFLFTHLNLLP